VMAARRVSKNLQNETEAENGANPRFDLARARLNSGNFEGSPPSSRPPFE
jgi:hypothetical protein